MGDFDWKWVFVLALLIGGYLYYDASSKSDLTKTLQERGLAAKGTIVDGYERSRRKSGTDYFVEVQYTPGDRGTKKQKLQVSSDYYRRIAKNIPVDVLYLGEDPLVFMLKGEPLYSETDTTVALVVLFVGLVGSAWLGFDYWKAKKSTA